MPPRPGRTHAGGDQAIELIEADAGQARRTARTGEAVGEVLQSHLGVVSDLRPAIHDPAGIVRRHAELVDRGFQVLVALGQIDVVDLGQLDGLTGQVHDRVHVFVLPLPQMAGGGDDQD